MNDSTIFGFVLNSKTPLSAVFAPAAFAFVLLLSSCGKECVEPASVEVDGTTKGLSVPTPPKPDESPRGGGEEPVITGNGDGISDDGDDLSDTERKKKQ